MNEHWSAPTEDRPSWSSRRLVRSRHDRMVAGVAGGIAETYGIDPTLVRLGFGVATLLGGVGIVAYAAAWLLVPEAGDVGRSAPRDRDWIMVGGLVLLGIGAIALFNRVAWHDGNEFIWPLLLIGGGAAVLWLRVRDDASEPAPLPGPPAAGPTFEARDPEEGETPEASDESDSPPSAEPVAAGDVPPASTAATAARSATETETAWKPPAPWPVAPWPPGGSGTTWPQPPQPPEPREHSILGWLTMSVLLIGAGFVALLDATGVVEVNPGVVLASALVTIGVALLVGAFWGRARWLVLLAIPLTVVAGVTAVLDVPLRGGIGERTERPVSASDLQSTYELGIGDYTVDLRAVDLPRGTTRVTTNLGIGQLNVLVPRGARVVVDAHADVGEVELFGRTDDGTDVDDHATVGPSRAASTLRIDANVGLGNLQVRYDEVGLR